MYNFITVLMLNKHCLQNCHPSLIQTKPHPSSHLFLQRLILKVVNVNDIVVTQMYF